MRVCVSQSGGVALDRVGCIQGRREAIKEASGCERSIGSWWVESSENAVVCGGKWRCVVALVEE